MQIYLKNNKLFVQATRMTLVPCIVRKKATGMSLVPCINNERKTGFEPALAYWRYAVRL